MGRAACNTTALLCGTLLLCSLPARGQDVLASGQDLSPVRALGVQERPRPEYDPIDVRLGGFNLSPRVSVGESYDDNIYATDTNAAGDRVTAVDGGLGIQAPAAWPALSATGGFNYQNYARHHLENYLDWNGGLALAETFAQRTSLNAGIDVLRNHLAREDPSFPSIAVSPPSFDTRRAMLAIRHDLPRGDIDLNVNFRSVEFNDADLGQGTELSQSFKNRNELILDLRADYLIGATTSAFLRAMHHTQDYRQVSEGLDRNATTDIFAGGSTFHITNLMQGEISAGVLNLRNSAATQGDQTTLAFRANLEMFLTQILTATLTTERTTGPADVRSSSSYVATSFTAALDYELRRNVILSARYARNRQTYSGLSDGEIVDQETVTARWLINRLLTADLNVSNARRSSQLEAYLGQNYRERIIGLTIELAL